MVMHGFTNIKFIVCLIKDLPEIEYKFYYNVVTGEQIRENCMMNATFSYVVKGGTQYNNTVRQRPLSSLLFTLYVLVKYWPGDGRDTERCTKIM
jgi:hypothetical protein